ALRHACMNERPTDRASCRLCGSQKAQASQGASLFAQEITQSRRVLRGVAHGNGAHIASSQVDIAPCALERSGCLFARETIQLADHELRVGRARPRSKFSAIRA